MADPYRFPPPRFAPGDSVLVVHRRGGVIIGRSEPLGGAWRVRWPNGLVTTEADDDLDATPIRSTDEKEKRGA